MKKHAAEDSTLRERAPRGISFVYILLRVSVILVMIAQIFNRDFQNVMLCVLTLVLFTLPSLMERRLKIELPNTLEVIILLFIYAAEILGEVRAYYVLFPLWDTMLHTINGFLCAAIGFCLVDLLNRSSNTKHFTFNLSPLYLALAAFTFSMTVGVLWEFFEYFMDRFFFLDMQKDTVVPIISSVLLDPAGANRPVMIQDIEDVIIVHGNGVQQALGIGGYLDIGLRDTMADLLVNFIGAVTFSVLGYFYIKHRGRGRGGFASRFIPRVLHDKVVGSAARTADNIESAAAEAFSREDPDKKP